MAQPQLAVMRSRVTGKMQTYTLSDQYAACSRFETDMDVLKNRIQTEFDSQSVDAQVESCKQLRGTFYDYMLLETWVPYESPLPAAAWLIIILIIGAVAVTVTVVVSSWAIRNYILGPFPKFVCDICGAEFDTLAALTAHRRTAHPGEKPYQCPYCGMSFDTAEELAEHMAECKFRPPEIPWWWWVIPLGAGVAALAVVGGVIGYRELKRQWAS